MLPTHKRVTGLSGNELYCLNQLGMTPGQLCVGNSVVSIGVLGGIGAGLSTLGGGEVENVTRLVHDGRVKAFNRMMTEAKQYGGAGLTGVSFDMINHAGNLEFITIGSTVHEGEETAQNPQQPKFSTSADVQQLYCQMDAGFRPRHFVFGNVAYSIGVGGNIAGSFKRLGRGEVAEYSQIFDRTRHLALTRLKAEAKQHEANSVIGIRTTVSPLLGAQEMMMVGTASVHPALSAFRDDPVTSDLTNEELWNIVNLGYLPLRLVMGVSVYSLGLKAGILSTLQSLGGGEISGLTEVLYEAREKALARIEAEAETCGADRVIGVKTRVYDLGGGLVEFMAIGTAVKKIVGTATRSPQLPPQAIIQDRETFIDRTGGGAMTLNRSETAASAAQMQRGPMTIIGLILAASFYALTLCTAHHR